MGTKPEAAEAEILGTELRVMHQGNPDIWLRAKNMEDAKAKARIRKGWVVVEISYKVVYDPHSSETKRRQTEPPFLNEHD